MYIVQSLDTRLERLLISDSFQSGLLCIDCLGNTSIRQSVITRSNYHLTDLPNVTSLCSRDSHLCCGRNMWVQFNFPGVLSTRTHHYFTVEETVISYGIDFSGSTNIVCGNGGGMLVEALYPPLYQQYFLDINIQSSLFERNLGNHLSVSVIAGHSLIILVKDCTFFAANELSMPKQIPLTSLFFYGTVKFHLVRSFFSIPSVLALAENSNNTVNITLTNVSCTENLGGGILIASDPLNRFDGQLHLIIQNSQVTINYLLYDPSTLMSPGITIQGSGSIAFLEGVQISHNSFAFSSKEDQEGVLEYEEIYALLTVNAEIHLTSATFINNTVSALGSFGSEVHFHGHNIFRHNVGVCGGALSLNTGSVMILYRDTFILIANNTADKFGGGICMDNGNWPSSFFECYYQIRWNNENGDLLQFPKIILEHNTASITGYSVYGYMLPCLETVYTYPQFTYTNYDKVPFQIFDNVFQFQFPPGTDNYQVSSKPMTLCFCPENIDCERRVDFLLAYPGQSIQVKAVGVGTAGVTLGISPAVVHSTIHSTHSSDENFAIVPEVLSLWNTCEYLNYTVLAPEGMWITVVLTVEGFPSIYPHMLEVELNTLLCPNGFTFSHNTMSCVCATILEQASVQCRSDTQTFVRSGSLWIGVHCEEAILFDLLSCV